MIDFFSKEIVASLKANPPLAAKPVYDTVVRAIDVVASLTGLLLTSPLLCVIALLVKLGDGGSVFYRQERTGKGGRSFYILKFRTMVVNAEHIGAKLTLAKHDTRVTRVGRFLREFHLDELPQLVNVLWGQMSLVGPRPALAFQKDYYEAWELPRLHVAPGITGLSQVSGGNALDWDDRILIDVYYVRNRSFRMYFEILARTFLQLFARGGVYNRDQQVRGWNRPVPDWYQPSHSSPYESR
jgi:lipopolysaccharide/colanic/teichoic acid biosynthesis glycosyltransferase